MGGVTPALVLAGVILYTLHQVAVVVIIGAAAGVCRREKNGRERRTRTVVRVAHDVGCGGSCELKRKILRSM